jgi:hypothetical protein
VNFTVLRMIAGMAVSLDARPMIRGPKRSAVKARR